MEISPAFNLELPHHSLNNPSSILLCLVFQELDELKNAYAFDKSYLKYF